MSDLIVRSFNGGKYMVGFDGSKLYALRYGQPWRDLVGDNLVLSMLQRVDELETQIDQFWYNLERSHDIESREELTAIAKKMWNPPNPMIVALHHIWKRDPNVAMLIKALEEILDKVDPLFTSDADNVVNQVGKIAGDVLRDCELSEEFGSNELYVCPKCGGPHFNITKNRRLVCASISKYPVAGNAEIGCGWKE